MTRRSALLPKPTAQSSYDHSSSISCVCLSVVSCSCSSCTWPAGSLPGCNSTFHLIGLCNRVVSGSVVSWQRPRAVCSRSGVSSRCHSSSRCSLPGFPPCMRRTPSHAAVCFGEAFAAEGPFFGVFSSLPRRQAQRRDAHTSPCGRCRRSYRRQRCRCVCFVTSRACHHLAASCASQLPAHPQNFHTHCSAMSTA